jgi:acetoin utilization deacetylase AcuC-like enzyme
VYSVQTISVFSANRALYPLSELNEAIWEELEKHNRTHLQNKDYSRSDEFRRVVKQALKYLLL